MDPMMPMSGNMTAMSVAPMAMVRNAAKIGSMRSSDWSICMVASSKNVVDICEENLLHYLADEPLRNVVPRT